MDIRKPVKFLIVRIIVLLNKKIELIITTTILIKHSKNHGYN